MKKWFILLLAIQFSGICFAQLKVQQLLTENLPNPISIDVAAPRFSWQLTSDKRNIRQTAYEIKVSPNPTQLKNGKAITWHSGKVTSDQSVHVPFAGTTLQAGEKYYWQVRVWDNTGKASAWSEPAFWQMGLLQPSDWPAKWIGPGFAEDTVQRPSPLLRKEFTISKKIKAATAYITAHGLYEAQLNGRRIGDAYLTPGWTSYNKRLPYQVYDVTPLLNAGANAVGATLGSGWYRGALGFNPKPNFYGKDIALLFQLHITYADGTSENIISDETWKSATGPIRYAEIYHGEIYDAQLEKKNWSTAGYHDQDWSPVKVHDFSKEVLVATINEPIRKHEIFKPIKVIKTPKGELVLDFGQNLVGWVTIKATGKAGDKIIISHAEVLDKAGNFYTENLRSAKAQATYLLSGRDELLEPHFTFFGFRYIKVEGYPGELKPENFTAVALYSDMKLTGTFTSSHPLINQLQKNIQWGQKGNFLDVPTDCPQRDERLGWTGDAQAFARTAAYNMHVNNFFAKWLQDLAADQRPDGLVPWVIPDVLRIPQGSAGWGEAATVIPWTMYLAYGDKRILANQYQSMKGWVDFMQKQSKNDLWNTGFHFGDWLFYSVGNDTDGSSAITSKYFIAQCFYAYSTQLLINAAEVLGKNEDAAAYTALLSKIKNAFLKEYTTPNGNMISETQTAYVLALQFDMLPENLRQQAADRLVNNIKRYNNHLTTGFLGTPYLCHTLTRFGYTDVAYSLLLQETYPSWLYPVKMGATTIWERWDGIKPDGTFQTPSMNSYNHYAYGAIGDWMYRTITGIDTEAAGPGYKKIRIKPHVGGNLTQAAAQLQTNYGLLSSAWKLEKNKFVLDVEIPANTSATVYLPAANPGVITERGKALASIKDIKPIGNEDGFVALQVGSGKYQFAVDKNK